MTTIRNVKRINNDGILVHGSDRSSCGIDTSTTEGKCENTKNNNEGDETSSQSCKREERSTSINRVTWVSESVLCVVGITQPNSTVISRIVWRSADQLLDTTSEDRMADTNVTGINVWADHIFISTSEFWVTGINGTVVGVITEEDGIKDTSNVRIASISGTDT